MLKATQPRAGTNSREMVPSLQQNQEHSNWVVLSCRAEIGPAASFSVYQDALTKHIALPGTSTRKASPIKQQVG
jgi:hypothetical protein